MTGTNRATIQKLPADLGAAYSAYRPKICVNLPCKRNEGGETCSLVGSNPLNTTADKMADGEDEARTWVALDADTKLVPCWLLGGRDAGCAYEFIQDLAARPANSVGLPMRTQGLCLRR